MEDRPRVLIVNDDPELLHTRCAVLESLGLSAVAALGVTQAGEMSARETYAAVLIDATNVSYYHAMQLCCSIKTARAWQKVIVLVTSHHVVSEDDCPDAIVVREHPEKMLPNIVAALRGDVPVDDEMTPEDS